MKIQFTPAAGKPRDLDLQPGDQIAYRAASDTDPIIGLVDIVAIDGDTVRVRRPGGHESALPGPAEAIYAMYELIEFAPGTWSDRL